MDNGPAVNILSWSECCVTCIQVEWRRQHSMHSIMHHPGNHYAGPEQGSINWKDSVAALNNPNLTTFLTIFVQISNIGSTMLMVSDRVHSVPNDPYWEEENYLTRIFERRFEKILLKTHLNVVIFTYSKYFHSSLRKHLRMFSSAQQV